MNAAARTTITAVLLAAATFGVYAWRIADTPPHLEIDEVIIGADAQSIAMTGRDLRGEFLPLYSQTASHSWYQPFVIYVTAAALAVLPLAEWSVRIPAVCIAGLNVALVFLLVRRLLRSDWIGIVAAVLLALTPAHFIHSRYAMDYLYPATFVLAWLLLLASYAERPSRATAIAAAAVLGIGFYSYISSMVMMPLYLVITLAFLWHEGSPRRTLAAVAAVFAVLLMPFVFWLLTHPAAIGGTADKYGVGGRLGYMSVAERLTMYWNMIGPSVLFMTGGSRPMFSTGKAGVFLFPLIVWLPLGIYEATVRERRPLSLVFVAGFLTAPLPSLLVTDENAPVFRALAIVPFGIVLASLGVARLWRSSNGALPLRRAVCAALLALAVANFGLFWSDYFGGYRVRVSSWIGGNVRGALEGIIERDAPGTASPVYFSVLKSTAGIPDGRNEYMPAYWLFYLKKHHREDLLARTQRFEPASVDAVPRGSLVLGNVGDVTMDALVARGDLKPLATIPELDGGPFFAIFQR